MDEWPVPRFSSGQKAHLVALVEAGPYRQADGVVRWRHMDIKRVIKERLGVDYHERHVGMHVKNLGFSHVRVTPGRTPKPSRRSKDLSGTLSAHLADLPEETPLEI